MVQQTGKRTIIGLLVVALVAGLALVALIIQPGRAPAGTFRLSFAGEPATANGEAVEAGNSSGASNAPPEQGLYASFDQVSGSWRDSGRTAFPRRESLPEQGLYSSFDQVSGSWRDSGKTAEARNVSIPAQPLLGVIDPQTGAWYPSAPAAKRRAETPNEASYSSFDQITGSWRESPQPAAESSKPVLEQGVYDSFDQISGSWRE